MAIPTGWAANKIGNTTYYDAQQVLKVGPGLGGFGLRAKIRIRTNPNTGSYDTYYISPIGSPDLLIYSYSGTTGKITPNNSNSAASNLYTQIFSGNNRRQLDNLNKGVIKATYAIASSTSTSTSFQQLQKQPGYTHLAPSVTPIQPGADPPPPGVDPENLEEALVVDAEGLKLNQILGDNWANFNQESIDAALEAAKPKPPEPTAEQLYAQNKPNIYRYPLANLDSVSEIGIKYDFLRIRTVDHISSLTTDLTGLGSALSRKGTTIEQAAESAGFGVNLSEKYLNSQRVYDYIILPMQPNISSSNSTDWGSDSMNIAQLIGGQLLNNYFGNVADKGFIDSFKQLIRDTVQQGGNLADIAVTNKSSIAALLAGSMVNANLLQRSTGTVINPNMEMLFNGPRLRTFNFQFDFTPRFDKEAQEIRKIISTLKYSMAPRRTPGNAFLSAPRIFLLDYIYNGGSNGNDFSSFVRADERGAPGGNKERFNFQTHPYLNKIKPCALLDVNVNYTPDGTYMTYKSNGSMTRYSIQLQFAEIEPIYSSDFEEKNGTFNPDSMGY